MSLQRRHTRPHGLRPIAFALGCLAAAGALSQTTGTLAPPATVSAQPAQAAQPLVRWDELPPFARVASSPPAAALEACTVAGKARGIARPEQAIADCMQLQILATAEAFTACHVLSAELKDLRYFERRQACLLKNGARMGP
jgi:hypothetical protein